MKSIFSLLMVASAATLNAQDSSKAVAPAGSALTINVGVVARSIVERQPQDTGTAFPADVGQLVCFTQIQGGSADAATTVHHVWFHGDTQVADVELQVGGSPWRTWSRRTVPADWTGAWRVEIRDAGGAALKRIDFTVGQ